MDDFNTSDNEDLMGEPNLDAFEDTEDEEEGALAEGEEEIPLSSLKGSDLGEDEELPSDEDDEEDDMEDLGRDDWEE